MFKPALIPLLVIILFAGNPAYPQPGKKEVIKILFVGNSLTYVNDLPKLVTELARQDDVTVSYKTLALPDYAFEDHLKDGNLEKEIEAGHYDYVIGQQGPSALPASQAQLLRDASAIARLCEKNKTRFALYMVWPSKDRIFDLDNVILSYSNSATQTGSVLCPAGEAWKIAWEIDPALPLYSIDNFHPSLMGSVLSALAVYGSIQNMKNFEFIEYKKCSWKNEITKKEFELLKIAALKALDE